MSPHASYASVAFTGISRSSFEMKRLRKMPQKSPKKLPTNTLLWTGTTMKLKRATIGHTFQPVRTSGQKFCPLLAQHRPMHRLKTYRVNVPRDGAAIFPFEGCHACNEQHRVDHGTDRLIEQELLGRVHRIQRHLSFVV